jgi:hypothetical protein
MEGPTPVAEHHGLGANADVEVVKGAAAHADALDDVHVAREHPQLEVAVAHVAHAAVDGLVGQFAADEVLAALQNRDAGAALIVLSEPTSGGRTAEAGADHHRLEVLARGRSKPPSLTTSSSRMSRIERQPVDHRPRTKYRRSSPPMRSARLDRGLLSHHRTLSEKGRWAALHRLQDFPRHVVDCQRKGVS